MRQEGSGNGDGNGCGFVMDLFGAGHWWAGVPCMGSALSGEDRNGKPRRNDLRGAFKAIPSAHRRGTPSNFWRYFSKVPTLDVFPSFPHAETFPSQHPSLAQGINQRKDCWGALEGHQKTWRGRGGEDQTLLSSVGEKEDDAFGNRGEVGAKRDTLESTLPHPRLGTPLGTRG